MQSVNKLENPYLDKFKAIGGDSYSRNFTLNTYGKRDELVKKYAWAVPNTEAIKTIAKYSPIIEIAAGSGYWASLVKQVGADIDAYDKSPWEKTWTDVLEGTESVANAYPNRTLFLCWPPYGAPVASNALKEYEGFTVIYVGEGPEGCTGDEEFHDLLNRNWMLEETVNIPQWRGIHDTLYVYKRE